MSNTAYVQPISSYLFWYGQAPGQVVIPSKVNYYDTFYQPGPDPDLGSPRTIPEVKTQAVAPTPQAYGSADSWLNTRTSFGIGEWHPKNGQVIVIIVGIASAVILLGALKVIPKIV